MDPKRISQTRGVSPLAPVFDLLSMVEDVQFAELVKRQVASCIAAFITRAPGGPDLKLGSRDTADATDGTTTTFEEMQPGMVPRLAAGESVTPFSPQVTDAPYKDQLTYLLRIIGANVGLPLSVALLDTSDTTFHGYRGELDQARMGFRSIQRWLMQRWHSPIYRWWLAREFPGTTTRHRWQTPGWPYIEPFSDVRADQLTVTSRLNSRRGVLAKRGLDAAQVDRESMEDAAVLVREARAAAAGLSDGDDLVDWRELLSLSGAPTAAPSLPTEVADEADARRKVTDD